MIPTIVFNDIFTEWVLSFEMQIHIGMDLFVSAILEITWK